MSPFTQALLLATAFIAALGLTGALTGLSEVLPDIPNQRSMHNRVVARGGGLSFALAYLTAIVVALIYQPSYLSPTVVAAAGGSLCLTLLGLLDDRYQLPALNRLLAQALICSVAAYLGADDQLRLGGYIALEGWPALLVQVLWLVAMVNFVNFMDGMDGFAGGLALLTCVAFAVLFQLDSGVGAPELQSTGVYRLFQFAYAALGAGLIGFLLWNIPPARIFMGDAGSYFLGFALAFPVIAFPLRPAHDIAILTARILKPEEQPALFDQWTGFFLCLPFVIDPTLTLLRRLRSGASLLHAHREHLYQRMSQAGKRPLRILALFSLLFFLPGIAPVALRAASVAPGLALLVGFIVLCLCLLIHALLAKRFGARLANSGPSVRDHHSN